MTQKTLEDIRENPIITNDANLIITMPNEKLKVGKHTFELQVKDDSGNESTTAAQAILIVVDKDAPTAVLTISDASGRPLLRNTIPFGQGFILNGKNSVDIGGKIVSYTWTLVE